MGQSSNGNGKATWAVGILVVVFLAWFSLSVTGFFHIQNSLANEAKDRANDDKALRECLNNKVELFLGYVSSVDKRLAVIESNLKHGGK